MKLQDFMYHLPEELIAQDPLEKRDESRLLIVDKKDGTLRHEVFKNIKNYLTPGDTLVLNETKVIPARLLGKIEGTEKMCEIFLLKRITDKQWECLVRPGKKLRVGAKAEFGDKMLVASIDKVLDDGNRIVSFQFDGIFEEILDKLGEMPLPPSIKHKLQDKDRYQTVYAKNEGSVAAPTAGLHFTKDLLKEIEEMGVNIAYVTLHVSLGTFRPVHVDDIKEHKMHIEEYHVSRDVCDKVEAAKASGHNVICVGTTSVRSIESAAVYDETIGRYILKPTDGETNIFIYPGYEYKICDKLITNFHLPGSTLIMLVSAISSREIVLNAYKEAVDKKYRFYSFGDACFFTNIKNDEIK